MMLVKYFPSNCTTTVLHDKAVVVVATIKVYPFVGVYSFVH